MAQDTLVVEGATATPAGPKRTSPALPIDRRGPTSAAALLSCLFIVSVLSEPAGPVSALPWTVNPTGKLSGIWYVLAYLVTMPAKELLNLVFLSVGAALRVQRMDEGDTHVRKLEVLETVDICYLALNTMVEFLGLNHIASFLLNGNLDMTIRSFSVWNGPAAFVMIMLVNDTIYWPFHYVAHWRSLYAYCHKQHHRQFVPFRGYKDAANQHPFEQIYGFSIFIGSMTFTSWAVGLHAATACVAILAWAMLNIGNHLAFDSSIHLPLPFPALPRDHQMHHRFPQCNYSTLTSLWDRIFGTYKSYRGFGQKAQEPVKKSWYEDVRDADAEEDEEPARGRPEAVPSYWSVVGLMVALLVMALLVEIVQSRQLPARADLLFFLRPIIVLVNMAVVCYATEGSPRDTTHLKLPKAGVQARSDAKTQVAEKDIFKVDVEPWTKKRA